MVRVALCKCNVQENHSRVHRKLDLQQNMTLTRSNAVSSMFICMTEMDWWVGPYLLPFLVYNFGKGWEALQLRVGCNC